MSPGIHVRLPYVPAQEFRVVIPLATHWQPATCEEVRCPQFLGGWKTVLPADSDLISDLKRSGRSYREERLEDGLVAFIFAPGQQCFRASTHKRQTGRPEIWIHRNRESSDRGQAIDSDEWVERSQETLDGLRQIREE